jgi:hypothetical protein
MFKLFGKKAPESKQSIITFDEAYCHSAGQGTDARTYRIAHGTTELVFRFPDFEEFWQTYLNANAGLSDATRIALRDEKAVFVFQVLENGTYMYLDGADDQGQVVLNAATLTPMGAGRALATFGQGAISIGIYHLGEYRTEVLWATMYEAG